MPPKPITILSPGRSGTTLLQNSLAKHPDINSVSNEILCWDSSGYSYYHNYIIKNFDINPTEYKNMNPHHVNVDKFNILGSKEYLKYCYSQENIVKFIYNHLTRPVIEWLEKQDHVFINLTRYNMLDCLISHQVIWDRIDNKESDTVYIDRLRAFEHMDFWLKLERHCDMWFRRKVIKIYYEDLLSNWDYWTNIILNASGHKIVKIPKIWQPQPRPRKLSQIENPELIKELQQYFGECIINMDNLQ